MSGLLKKRIQVDRNLGIILSTPEGTIVSYAEIQKGLHKYIRDNHLRTDLAGSEAASISEASEAPQPEAPRAQPAGAYCISCGEGIPSGAVFCDLCGALQ